MSDKAVYCISSRTTGANDNPEYLLTPGNLIKKTDFSVLSSVELNYKTIRDKAKEKYRLAEGKEIEKYYEIVQKTYAGLCERNSYFENNRQLLESLHLMDDATPLFQKEFYKYNDSSNDYSLYAVKELENIEAECLKNNNILWCEVLIKFLWDIEADAKEFTLILHDKDIPSDKHSQNSCVAFLGNEDCQKEGLITEDLCKKLTNERVKLNVVFFKHELNCIYKVLTKTDSPKEGLEEALKSLDGFEILKSHAAEVLSFKVKRKEVYE